MNKNMEKVLDATVEAADSVYNAATDRAIERFEEFGENIEKRQDPTAFTDIFDASGGYLSCFGKKDTKEPTWGGTDREAYRSIVRFVPCYPGFEPSSPSPLPAPIVT